MKRHQLTGNRARLACREAERVTSEQAKTSDHVRLLRHLESCAAHLPQHVTAQEIVLLAVMEARADLAHPGGAHLAVMLERALREGSCLPTLHACRRDGDPVDAAAANRCIASNALEAFAAKEL